MSRKSTYLGLTPFPAPFWDNSAANNVTNATPLGDDVANVVGDRVVYGNDTNSNGTLDSNEILHSGIVTGIDGEGNATRITGKWGEGSIWDHFPTDAPMEYGTMRRYYRTAPGSPTCTP